MNQLACQSNNIYEKRQDNQFIHYVNQVWNFYFNFFNTEHENCSAIASPL